MLVIGFQAEVTRLIPLYTVGVFVSFTLSQTGMVRHWRRHLATETDPEERRRMRRAQAINGFGAVMTGVVLVTVLITKFLLGAWIAIAAMAGFYVLMLAIKRHYDHVAAELDAAELDSVLPSRNHAIVLVARLHRPTLRAIAYARATRPDVLEAVTVNVDDADTRRLVREWDRRKIPVSLKVVESPYREITKPVLDYVKRVRTKNPRDIVTVFVPEYVVGHWWEQVLHNQSALRIKTRLLFQPGVMVVSVPWQLEVVRADRRTGRADPRCHRRGYPTRACATTGPPRRRRPRRARRGRRDRPAGADRPTAAARTGPVPARRSRDRPAAHAGRGPASDRGGPRGHPGLDGPRARPATSARSPTAGTASRGSGSTTGASAWSSSGTRCRGSGCARSSPKTAAVRSAAPTRSPCSNPLRAGSSRRARGPAPVAAAAATGSTPTGRPSAR